MIIPATLITAAFFVFVVGAGLRAQWLPIKAGKESMVGKTATALTPINAQSGKVFVEGAYWNAVSECPVEEGKPVEIIGVQGLTLESETQDIGERAMDDLKKFQTLLAWAIPSSSWPRLCCRR